MAEKKVMNDMELENVSGGDYLNLNSEGGQKVIKLLINPRLGKYVAEWLKPLGTEITPDNVFQNADEKEAFEAYKGLTEQYPELFKDDDE